MPRKKEPKITEADVRAWCNAHGWWLLEKPLVMVGTSQTQVYKVATGELLILVKEISAKGVMVTAGDEED